MPPLPLVDVIDKDHDGELSAEELASAPAALKSLDANKDGVLRDEEIMPPMPFGRGGPGGPGGPGQKRNLVKNFDKDSDGLLNDDERAAAREGAQRGGGGGRGMGGRGFPGARSTEPPQPGKSLTPADVQPVANEDLYDTSVLRTLFINFENKDWEAELADFNDSDVDVPCKLIVDGKTYNDVGVHFRGNSSYMGVPQGYKRSLNLSLDYKDGAQRLYGYKTLNLLNGHEDPSLMSSVLYSDVARKFIPAPKANFVRVVINGESWGIYVNVEQFNKDFLSENYRAAKGLVGK